jgi:hypothetical protein
MKMTKKEISPEIALKQIQKRIIAVVDSVENFADTLPHCEDEFKRGAYNDFRDSRRSREEKNPYCSNYEDVAFSTLLDYGVIEVARTEFEERIIESWDYHFRINGQTVISEHEMNSITRILPNCSELMNIEKIDGRPVQAKVNYYKINFARIEQLETMRHTLASFSE